MTDPFAHHPEFRDRIVDPQKSFFRDFSVEKIERQADGPTTIRDWCYTDADREALRAAALSGHTGDLWVFGYGSLMWDPALRFTQVRRAHVAGYARRIILFDTRGGRGNEDSPGLMAALDHGDGCEGLAFKIDASAVAAETEILCRRELLGSAYLPRFVTAHLDDGPVQALTFVANYAADHIRPDLTRDEQIRYIAHGSGRLGTSRDYLANIVSQLTALSIQDDACVALLRDVDNLIASAVT